MKGYKELPKDYIGASDISTLILAGYSEEEESGFSVKPLMFGSDGEYYAYIWDESKEGGEIEIGEHYEKVAAFNGWMKIYDDLELVWEVKHCSRVDVYRSGDFGVLIHIVG